MERWERRDAKREAKRKMPMHGADMRTVVANALLKRAQAQALRTSVTQGKL